MDHRAGFNCVRLTYSIDMVLGPDVKVADSFAAASGKTGVPAPTFQSLSSSIVQNNPSVASGSLINAYSTVIDSLARHNVTVILDNHVSKAVWCNFTDGNGWFSDSGIYISANSQFFDTNNWLAGLKAMATFAQQHPNVVGISLRNEMRPIPILLDPLHNDWYSHVTKGSQTIHGANLNLLIMTGGVNGATDISLLRTRPLDTSSWPDRTVWEFHI